MQIRHVSKRKTIIIILIIALLIILGTVCCNLVINKKSGNTSEQPEVGFLEIDASETLTVYPKYGNNSSGPDGNEHFSYCLALEKKIEICTWSDSNKFHIEFGNIYYIYIKSLTTGQVSEPKELDYATREDELEI